MLVAGPVITVPPYLEGDANVAPHDPVQMPVKFSWQYAHRTSKAVSVTIFLRKLRRPLPKLFIRSGRY